MKKIIFFLVLLNSTNLLAQNCIPDPGKFAEQLLNCFKAKDRSCLENHFILWNEVEPLFDSMAVYRTKMMPGDMLPDKDSVKLEYETTAKRDFMQKVDSLMAAAERMHINWATVKFMRDKGSVTNENNMPENFWFSEGRIKFRSGDSVYKIRYEALLSREQWKLVDLGNRISVFDTTGNNIDGMSEYGDYGMSDSASVIMDSAMAAIDSVAKEYVPETSKQPVKKKPIKKSTSTQKQPARKPKQK